MIDARDALQVGDAASAHRVHRLCRQLEGAGQGAHEARDPEDRQPRRPPAYRQPRSHPLRRPRATRTTLQQALDDWAEIAPLLHEEARRLEAGEWLGVEEFAAEACASPLPRAYQWADGSAYVNHVELVRKARGAEMPPSFWTDPLMYQGGSDSSSARAIRSRWPTKPGASISRPRSRSSPTTCRWASTPRRRARHIKLVMLVNDVSLRNLIPGELAKGFGFFQSKPSSAFSPVAVTPDELGAAWDGGKIAPAARHAISTASRSASPTPAST